MERFEITEEVKSGVRFAVDKFLDDVNGMDEDELSEKLDTDENESKEQLVKAYVKKLTSIRDEGSFYQEYLDDVWQNVDMESEDYDGDAFADDVTEYVDDYFKSLGYEVG